MPQRQNVYVAKTKCIRCKDDICMLPRQNVHVAKTKSTCCKDKRTVLGVTAPAEAFSPKMEEVLFLKAHDSCCLASMQNR